MLFCENAVIQIWGWVRIDSQWSQWHRFHPPEIEPRRLRTVFLHEIHDRLNVNPVRAVVQIRINRCYWIPQITSGIIAAQVPIRAQQLIVSCQLLILVWVFFCGVSSALWGNSWISAFICRSWPECWGDIKETVSNPVQTVLHTYGFLKNISRVHIRKRTLQPLIEGREIACMKWSAISENYEALLLILEMLSA